MMKVILGSALGGLVAGGIALMAAGQARATMVGAAVDAGAPVTTTAAAPAIQCAPHQDATVTRVLVNGREAAALACVDRVDPRMPYYAPAAVTTASLPPAYAPPPSYPAPTVVAQPVSTSPERRAPSARPAVYRAGDDIVRYEPDRRRDERSVAKTVLIIGGSAGAGAGVGAIAGGKKGAIIGAAIGGGAASIYEATKR